MEERSGGKEAAATKLTSLRITTESETRDELRKLHLSASETKWRQCAVENFLAREPTVSAAKFFELNISACRKTFLIGGRTNAEGLQDIIVKHGAPPERASLFVKAYMSQNPDEAFAPLQRFLDFTTLLLTFHFLAELQAAKRLEIDRNQFELEIANIIGVAEATSLVSEVELSRVGSVSSSERSADDLSASPSFSLKDLATWYFTRAVMQSRLNVGEQKTEKSPLKPEAAVEPEENREVCTYATHGKKAIVQEWAYCRTCNGNRPFALCAPCSDHCHAGHVLEWSVQSPSKIWCDCGGGYMFRQCRLLFELGHEALLKTDADVERQDSYPFHLTRPSPLLYSGLEIPPTFDALEIDVERQRHAAPFHPPPVVKRTSSALDLNKQFQFQLNDSKLLSPNSRSSEIFDDEHESKTNTVLTLETSEPVSWDYTGLPHSPSLNKSFGWRAPEPAPAASVTSGHG